MYNMKNNC